MATVACRIIRERRDDAGRWRLPGHLAIAETRAAKVLPPSFASPGRQSTVDAQISACDVTAFIGCKEESHRCDLFGPRRTT